MHADFQMLLDTQRHIDRRIAGRLSVGLGVDAEEREIARMAGPHPIVRIRSELTDGRRRRTDHADIGINLLDKKVITVSAVKSFQLQPVAFGEYHALPVGKALGYFGQVFGRQVIDSLRVGIIFQLFLYEVGHVQNLVDEGD